MGLLNISLNENDSSTGQIGQEKVHLDPFL